jgi:hypothetical protein
MPLTNLSLPAILPERAVPFDAAMAFANPQTLTASGYVNALNTQLDLMPGRFDGYLNLDVSAMDLSSGDETYKLFLLGSNDPAWGNGNVEMLAVRDFAAASAGRLLGTICPPSYAVPTTGRSATKFMIPFTNLIGAYQLRYLQLYAQLAGTTPSLTLSAWISPDLA